MIILPPLPITQAVPTLVYNGEALAINNASSYTLNNVPIGTPSTNRVVLVNVSQRGSNIDTGTSSVSINGVSATQVGSDTSYHEYSTSAFWYATIPTGTEVTVQVNFNKTAGNCCVQSWSLYNTEQTHFVENRTENSSNTTSVTYITPANSFLIASYAKQSTTVNINSITGWDEERRLNPENYTLSVGSRYYLNAEGLTSKSVSTDSSAPAILQLVSFRGIS